MNTPVVQNIGLSTKKGYSPLKDITWPTMTKPRWWLFPRCWLHVVSPEKDKMAAIPTLCTMWPLGTMARWWGAPALDQWLKRTNETMWQMSFHSLMPSPSQKTMENKDKAKYEKLFCPKRVMLLSCSLLITQQDSPWWKQCQVAAGVLQGNSVSRVSLTKERRPLHFCSCFLKGTKPLPSTTGAKKKFQFLVKTRSSSNEVGGVE